VRHSIDSGWGMRGRILSVIGLACTGVLVACGPSPSAKPTDGKLPAQTNDASAKRYGLTGRVVSIDKSNQSMTIDGNEITGFMAAMTMPYQVKDASVLDKLSPGDQIKAEIVVGNEGPYLENIVPAQKAASPSPAK
jgi:protein SCO1/2